MLQVITQLQERVESERKKERGRQNPFLVTCNQSRKEPSESSAARTSLRRSGIIIIAVGQCYRLPSVKVEYGVFRLLLRHFEKCPYYVVLSLDFSPLSAECGAVLLEIGVGFLAHANGRPVFAFHLQFIRFITNKYLWVPTTSGDESLCQHHKQFVRIPRCTRFTAAKSHSTMQEPTTTTQRYGCPIRSLCLLDYERASIKRCTTERSPFLSLSLPRTKVKKEVQRNQKTSPLALNPRLYTAGIRSSNLLEPICFCKLVKSVPSLKKVI